MSSPRRSERPVGVYLVSLYFVLSGFLESIRKYQEANFAMSWNPIGEHSLWQLLVDPIIYLALAYLIWRYASVGRLAALVYGYGMLLTYTGVAIYYFVSDQPLTITPLFVALAIFHVFALPAVLWYLQPKAQKKLFHVSLWDILLSSD